MPQLFARPSVVYIIAFVAFAFLHVASAFGQVPQRSQFEVQLSTDGVNWQNQLTLRTTQAVRVYGRVLVSWVGNGTPDPLFFNICRFQPTGLGWSAAAGDLVIPFNPTGRVTANYTPGAEVLGRVFGATTVAAIAAQQYTFNGQGYLRFAEVAATNHPGQGSGTNNVTGGGGMNCANNTLNPQLGIFQRPLFTWGMVFSAGRSGSMEWSIPQEGFRTSGATANPPSTRSATWVTSTSPFTTVEAPTLPTVGASLVLSPCDLPVIQVQPQSLGFCAGGTVQMSVQATGAQSFQWRRGGILIPGATSATLAIVAASSLDVGSYDCVVSNTCGPVTSSSVNVTLNEPVSVVTQPSSTTTCAGQPATFTVTAAGTAPQFQWRKGGSDIPGATSDTLTIASTSVSDGGLYDCVISNTCGALNTASADLVVSMPVSMTSQPLSITACAGQPAAFSVAVAGTDPQFQWRKDGSPIPGVTGSTLAIEAVDVAAAGTYDCVVTNSCGAVTSSAATLIVNSPVSVSEQPIASTECTGQPASFTVNVSGTSPTFQWRKNGSVISGETGSVLAIAAATIADAGTYDCVIANACGSVTTSRATLTVREPPLVIAQPNSIVVCQGQVGAFYVAARGTALLYQWRKNGIDISGAHGATLVIASATVADSGAYDCVVGNECGSLTTGPADLVVSSTPSIVLQPVSTSTCAGEVTILSVGVQGSGLAMQWRKEGVNIPGATGPVFAIGASAEADAGSYDCVINNSCGSVYSSIANLTVNTAPTVLVEPMPAVSCAGESASFIVGTPAADAQFQWRKDGSDIPGATNATFTIVATSASDAGSFDCVISNACGTVVTASASLRVNVPISVAAQPTAATACTGQSASFTVVANGSSPMFQWRRDGVSIPGATSATLTIAAVSVSDVGSYDCLISNSCAAATTASANLTVNVPVSVTAQPVASTTCAGQPASFSVTVAGTAPQFQWRKGGTNVPGGTSATLTIASVSEADAGAYFCVVSNSCGSVSTSTVQLTVGAPLSLTEQPTALTRCEGQSATFSVAASGTSPVYQWRRNGEDIPGATSSTLAIASVGLADGGSYDCVVSSACGVVASSTATLTVNTAPLISVQPTSITPDIGQAAATFTVAATEATSYRWRRNGVELTDGGRFSGTTELTLTISGVTWNDPGTYSCVLTNACGTATTTDATLSIFACNQIAANLGTQPFGNRANMGQAYSGVNAGTLMFGGTVDGTTALGDTWLLAGGSWSRVAIAGPAIRAITTMCELGNGRVLLFGGQAVVQDVASAYGDTWEWNGTSWTRVAITGPSPRSDHTMAYDSVRNRVVLFGGLSNTGASLNDTWEWDGSVWTQVASTGPGARFGHSSAFDPVRGETLVFGGWDDLFDGETWAWNGATWRLASTTGVGPRLYATMAFNDNVGKVMLFGGFEGGANVKNDSYYWTGTEWQATGLSAFAAHRWLHAMSFDRTVRGMVINGGRTLGQAPLSDSVVLSSRAIPTSQPQNQTLVLGGAATFGVTSSRADTLYQWHKDGVNLINDARISGATDPILTINSLQVSDGGSYSCSLLNACGTNVSRAAPLGCVPTVAQSPAGGEVSSGRRLVLIGQIVSTGTTTYRWRKDGLNLFNGALYSGVTTQTLTINAEDPSQSGVYTLTATNSCGTSTTNGAAVTVSCLADVNSDGNVDGDDVIVFFAAWDVGAEGGDVNDDGSTDGDDVIALFDRWDRGC